MAKGSSEAATASRAFVEAAAALTDGSSAPSGEGWRPIAQGDLKELSPAEVEEHYFHALRLVNGHTYFPKGVLVERDVPAYLKAWRRALERRGSGSAFDRRGASHAWVTYSANLSARLEAVFLLGTDDGLARVESNPRFDAVAPEVFFARWKAVQKLRVLTSPLKHKGWAPLATDEDLCERGRAVLAAAIPSVAACSREPMVLNAYVMLAIRHDPPSVEALCQLGKAAVGVLPGLAVPYKNALAAFADEPALEPVRSALTGS